MADPQQGDGADATPATPAPESTPAKRAARGRAPAKRAASGASPDGRAVKRAAKRAAPQAGDPQTAATQQELEGVTETTTGNATTAHAAPLVEQPLPVQADPEPAAVQEGLNPLDGSPSDGSSSDGSSSDGSSSGEAAAGAAAARRERLAYPEREPVRARAEARHRPTPSEAYESGDGESPSRGSASAGAQAAPSADADAGAVPTFDVVLRIRRYDPERDAEPHWEDYDVTVHGTDRLLDALHKIKWEQDGSLTFRRSCAHGVCGSDAMRINGRNRLACKTLVKDLEPSRPITVEAIKGLPVEKDLVVDMEPFFASYREVMPFLITTGHEPTRERVQSQADRERFDDTTKCILCAACTTSCPVFWTDGQYFGPAAIVNAHRFIFDSRDEGSELRLEVLNDKEGVWRCRTTFNCTEACPRGIQVTKAIQEVKRALLSRRV